MAVQWTDDGIVLTARPHGETAALAEILTREHGKHAGLVHGGQGRKSRPILQPGNAVRATWRARIIDHLGAYAVEPVTLRAGVFMEDRRRLAGMAAACALAALALPEREAHPRIHDGLALVLGAMGDTEEWPALLLKWELGLLTDLGYGLALERCALTGSRDGVSHVSPASGRAVCGDHPDAAEYRDRLLPLPAFLVRPGAGINQGDIMHGFALTGYFLERRVLWPADRRLPDARTRLIAMLAED